MWDFDTIERTGLPLPRGCGCLTVLLSASLSGYMGGWALK